MECPAFIAIETSAQAPYYPLACAWSLADGRIKTSLIQPSDEWPLELCHGDYLNASTLLTQGHSIKDIVIELNADFNSRLGYCHSDFPAAGAFEHFAEAMDMHPEFEWTESSSDLASILGEHWRDQLQEIAFTRELNLCQAEDQIRAMLWQWADYNGVLPHHHDDLL